MYILNQVYEYVNWFHYSKSPVRNNFKEHECSGLFRVSKDQLLRTVLNGNN